VNLVFSSTMPRKKSSVWKLVAIFALGGGLLTPIIGYFLVKSYIRSDEFSSIVKYNLSKEVGGRVEVANSEWDGWTLRNEKISILAGEKVQDVELQRVSVELDPKGVFDKVWRISTVHVRDATLHVEEQSLTESESRRSEVGEHPVSFSFSDAWKALLPQEVEVDSVLIENSNGSFESDFSNGVWNNTQLRLERAGEDYLVEIPRGTVSLSLLEKISWEISSIQGRVKPESYFINKAELRCGGTGILKVTGEGDYDGKATLEGELNDLLLSELLQENWKQRVSGAVNGNFVAYIEDEATVKGRAWIDGAVITALPVLDQLASQTGIYKFRQVAFDTCEFDYFIDDDSVKLSKVVAESENFVKVTGRVTKTDERITGVLQVGFTDEILAKMPKGSKQVFSEFKDGYYWAPVHVSHENDEWKEDLSSRMVAAVATAYLTQAPEKATELLNEVTEFIGEEGNAEKVEEVLEKGSKIIDTGVKSLFDLLGK